MTDYNELIERLRNQQCQICPICHEAADAIKQLVKENEKLKKMLPSVVPGQKVWKPDGTQGFISSLYLGKKGIQRLFVMFGANERMNLKPNGIGRDILLVPPEK